MKDPQKNMVAVIIIAIIVAIATHYFLVDVMLFPLMVCSIAVWFMITPFKLYEDK